MTIRIELVPYWGVVAYPSGKSLSTVWFYNCYFDSAPPIDKYYVKQGVNFLTEAQALADELMDGMMLSLQIQWNSGIDQERIHAIIQTQYYKEIVDRLGIPKVQPPR